MYKTNANNLSDATLNTGNTCKILTSWEGDALWFINVSIYWKNLNNPPPPQKRPTMQEITLQYQKVQ